MQRTSCGKYGYHIPRGGAVNLGMNYSILRERPTQFLALTSLHVTEFDELLTDFGSAWERDHRYYTQDGAGRRQPAHQERANAVLVGTDTKFFSAKPYKNIFLQHNQAANFGVSQTRVSRLSTRVLAVLNQLLARRGLLPVRDGTEVAQRPTRPYDGVERGTPRNAAREGQREEYRAKRIASPEKHDLMRCYPVHTFSLGPGSLAAARQETGRRLCHVLTDRQRAALGPGAALGHAPVHSPS